MFSEPSSLFLREKTDTDTKPTCSVTIIIICCLDTILLIGVTCLSRPKTTHLSSEHKDLLPSFLLCLPFFLPFFFGLPLPSLWAFFTLLIFMLPGNLWDGQAV